jgi:hypothetical protein
MKSEKSFQRRTKNTQTSLLSSYFGYTITYASIAKKLLVEAQDQLDELNQKILFIC